MTASPATSGSHHEPASRHSCAEVRRAHTRRLNGERPRLAVREPGPSCLSWRCRESNPGPPPLHKGFSVRSPLGLYSDPPVTRTSRSDDPSRCLMSLPAPRPGGQVSSLNDAGLRGGSAPGPTESHSLRRRGRTRADCCRRLLVCNAWLTRSSLPSSARFPLIDGRSRNRSPPSTPVAAGVRTP